MTYSGTAKWLHERLWFGYVIGGVAWVVWIGSLAVGGWYKDAEGTLLGGDHLAFYSAARNIHDGHPAGMYDSAKLHAYQQSLIGWEWSGVERYRNPPFYALLYLPTAGLWYYASFLVWTAISFGLLVLSLFLLAPARPWRVFAWAVAFYPVFATISFGQNTMQSLAIFAGVYRLLESDRKFSAGLVAGLLWFKPPLLIGLLVWWAFFPRRYIACWLGVAVTGAVLAAVSFLALPDASRAFVETLGENVGHGGEGMWNKHTPKAFFEMLLPEPPRVEGQPPEPLPWQKVAVWVLTLAVVAASVAVAWRVARKSGAPVAVMFPVAVFLSLWASPHALIYEWALLLAAGVVLWERLPASRDVWVCLFALVWVTLAASTPLALLQIRHLQMPIAVQISLPVLGAVGWFAARELARGRSTEAQG
jgi:alpha-1,2-mannosyltransferase